MLHGFLNLAKPAGITSHDAVAQVRRLAGQKRVGHAGTLDPAATGVLPIALGQATRLVEYLADSRKGYYALIELGVTTETDDAEGRVIAQAPVPELDGVLLEATLQQFRGSIMQVPPIYSALHHRGQRLYDLARAGQAPELQPRPVLIDRLELRAWRSPVLEVEVACGKGTYIRALARDIGAALGCGAHLRQLVRTFVGGFRLEEATPLAEIQVGRVGEVLLPSELAVDDWERVLVAAPEAAALRNGQSIQAAGSAQRARAHDEAGVLVALLERATERWQPIKVFSWS